jgi:hypothetical protein
MNFEPPQFFIGLMDFFTILLPGALLGPSAEAPETRRSGPRSRPCRRGRVGSFAARDAAHTGTPDRGGGAVLGELRAIRRGHRSLRLQAIEKSLPLAIRKLGDNVEQFVGGGGLADDFADLIEDDASPEVVAPRRRPGPSPRFGEPPTFVPQAGARRTQGTARGVQRPVDLRLGQPDEGGVAEPSRSNGRWTRHRRRWREHPPRARARDPAQTPRPSATVARTLAVRAGDDGGGRVLVARPVTGCLRRLPHGCPPRARARDPAQASRPGAPVARTECFAPPLTGAGESASPPAPSDGVPSTAPWLPARPNPSDAYRGSRSPTAAASLSVERHEHAPTGTTPRHDLGTTAAP